MIRRNRVNGCLRVFDSHPRLYFFFSVVSSRAFITSRKVFSFRKWRGMVSIEQNYGNNTGQSQKKTQIIKWTNQSSKQILERFPSAGKFDFTSDWLQKWQRVKCNPLHTQKIIKHINFGSMLVFLVLFSGNSLWHPSKEAGDQCAARRSSRWLTRLQIYYLPERVPEHWIRGSWVS